MKVLKQQKIEWVVKRKEMFLFNKTTQTTKAKAFAFPGTIFPLTLQLNCMGKMTYWLSTNWNQ